MEKEEKERERAYFFLLFPGRYFLTTVFMPDSTSKQSQQSTHNYVRREKKKEPTALFSEPTFRFSSWCNNKLHTAGDGEEVHKM